MGIWNFKKDRVLSSKLKSMLDSVDTKRGIDVYIPNESKEVNFIDFVDATTYNTGLENTKGNKSIDCSHMKKRKFISVAYNILGFVVLLFCFICFIYYVVILVI